jgi:DNA-binding transcriptional LysR family regulator
VTSMQSAPSGLLRISVATDFGVNHLSPVLGDFLQLYPDITVNMVLNNRYVELISEGFDMAVRIGELEDSTLRAPQALTRRPSSRMIAAPSYFQKFGPPAADRRPERAQAPALLEPVVGATCGS